MDGLSIDMHGQCAWCVMVEDGPYKGRPLFRETSQGVTPLLVNGYTHGICPTCDAILRGTLQLKRELKKGIAHATTNRE
jgi:hypothetical protein